MYTRTNSVTLSIETNHHHFAAYSTTAAMAARSREPEIFTFEHVLSAPHAPSMRSYAPTRPRKRCTRVMYPANVRKYLPPAEKTSPAKRWLLALCLVLLWQIYTEEPCVDTTDMDIPAGEEDHQVIPFLSTEELLSSSSSSSSSTSSSSSSSSSPSSSSSSVEAPLEENLSRTAGEESSSSSWSQILLNTTCPSSSPGLIERSEISRMYEQSTRNGYVVALLVYHRLGGDNN